MSRNSVDVQALLQQQQQQFQALTQQQQQQFQALLQEQQQQQQQQMQALLEAFGKLVPSGTQAHQPSLDSLSASITEFVYEPADGLTFDAWFAQFQDVFAIDCAALDDKAKVRFLLRKLNTLVHDKYRNFILPKKPRDFDFDQTVACLRQLFGSQASLFNMHYNCLKLVKRDADDFVTYAGVINRACEQFQFGTLTQDQFKCLIFICGLQSAQDTELRLRLLDKLESYPQLNLQKLTEECNWFIRVRQDSRLVESKPHSSEFPVSIGAVAVDTQKRTNEQKCISQQKRPQPAPTASTDAKRPNSPCWLCGAVHFVRNCPFRKHTCAECGKKGHKDGYCSCSSGRHVKQQRPTARRKPKKQYRANGVYAIIGDDICRYRKYAVVTANGHPINFRVDTGSDLTLLSSKTWTSIGHPSLCPPSVDARDVAGNQVKLLGELVCTFGFNGSAVQATCFITENDAIDLLGVELIEKLGMYKSPMDAAHGLVEGPTDPDKPYLKSVVGSHKPADSHQPAATDVLQRYPRIYGNRLGLCTQTKASLSLKPGARPVFRPKRPVPYAALSAVEKELDLLEQNGVISRVNHSHWAAPIVAVKKKDGSFRICADFSTGLNDALEPHQYPLPRPDDIFTVLNGGAIFTRIDFADAYLQVEVDEQSKQLLTINTHRGLYRYNRLPFGVKSAPGIFQQIMDTMLAGLKGAVAYLDDVIIVGKDNNEHQRNLEAVLKRIDEFGFCIRPEKCSFGMARIKYLGFIFDKYGRRPDPAKIEAIKSMPIPTDVANLRSFLGMLNYYGSFVKEMRELRAPLDALLKKDQPFVWSRECQAAFDKAKQVLNSNLLLTHYDPSMEIIVAADASEKGLGAVIMHRFPDGSEKAIAHASRALTSAERKYSQIEKEALSLIFAVKKFHCMIYDRKFTLLTDHQPLLSIFGCKKGIPVHSANRLQRWAIILLAYDFSIRYRSSTHFGCADSLSRLLSNRQPSNEDAVIASVDADVQRVFIDAVSALPMTAETIRAETSKDPLLKEIMSFMQRGWPQEKAGQIQQFFNRRDSLSVSGGCLLSGERVVIPTSLQHQVLCQLHRGHPGIVRMKALARSHAYWPGIDSEIEDLVKRCHRCSAAAKLPVKTTLAPWPVPLRPWSRVHADFAGPYEGRNFLIVIDALTKWPEVLLTNSTTATATVALLTDLFARFGFPETLVTDNGSQFRASHFEDFCRKNGVVHVCSPPHHPQSNGQVERFVDTFKRTMEKLKGDATLPENLATFLLRYRTSPNPSIEGQQSPAELMFGRNLRTDLSLLHPVPARAAPGPGRMSENFNRHHGARRRTFTPGSAAYMLNKEGQKPRWVEATIIRRKGRVVYDVRVGDEIWTRHANQLRRRPDETVTQAALPTPMVNFGPSSPQGSSTMENADQSSSTAIPRSPRPARARRPTRRLEPDPRLPSYEWA
uniref:RNA-directed DNA polymerase n=1 Tax=Trichuris muris TaxID=70415 RepID=A0A5S6QGC4_TRIMR